MKWLRLYSEVLHDPKVQRLPAHLFKHWINLLLLANEQEERGVLPDMDTVAFELRITEEEAEETVGFLLERGLLDRTAHGLAPHNWELRQPKRDAPSTERTRAFRQRNTPAVASDSRGNTDETRREHAARALDLDLEEKREELEEIPPVSPPAGADAADPAIAGTPTKRHGRQYPKPERRLEPRPEFRDRMVAKYSGIWNPGRLDELIAEAENYYRQEMTKGKYTDIEMCIDGSLADKRDRVGARTAGARAVNRPPPPTPTTDESSPSPQAIFDMMTGGRPRDYQPYGNGKERRT